MRRRQRRLSTKRDFTANPLSTRACNIITSSVKYLADLKKNGLHFIIFYVKYVYDCNTFVWKQFQTLSQCMDVADKEDNFTYGNLACY